MALGYAEENRPTNEELEKLKEKLLVELNKVFGGKNN